jgi:hypothetical protein
MDARVPPTLLVLLDRSARMTMNGGLMELRSRVVTGPSL